MALCVRAYTAIPEFLFLQLRKEVHNYLLTSSRGPDTPSSSCVFMPPQIKNTVISHPHPPEAQVDKTESPFPVRIKVLSSGVCLFGEVWAHT